jgi:hypothetical protein
MRLIPFSGGVMNDESQKSNRDPNKIDFPDSLFGENQDVKPFGSTTRTPSLIALDLDSRRNMGIVLGIIAVLCCLIVAFSASGFYYIKESSQAWNAQNTATAEVIAQAVATNKAYATGTAVALSTQLQATAVAQATLNANTTATLIAHRTERANYPFIETFDDNKKAWDIAKRASGFFTYEISVKNGVYSWEFAAAKKTFAFWGNYKSQESLKDFDVYVDGVLKEGDPENYCYGLVFRESPDGVDYGAYTFEICENGQYSIFHYNKEKGWNGISGWQASNAIKAGDWNRLEISARGSHFVFTVNDVQIFEMDDDRQAEGYLSLLVNIHKEAPGKIWLDNFGLRIP